MEAEDAAAHRLLEKALRAPIRFREANILKNPKAHTAGVVRYLCAAAQNLHEKKPRFSAEIARTAYEIARSLEEDPQTRRWCIGLSLREYANALKYLGHFAEALKALAQAEILFDDSPGSDPYDVAILWYIRGMVFVELERYGDAERLARKCARVFRGYGDSFRELCARLLQAWCLSHSGHHAKALPVYQYVEAKARAEGQRNILARALHAAAGVSLNNGALEKAEQQYTEALVLFDELGLVTEKARAAWFLALVLVQRGDLAAGAQSLDVVREEPRRLGLHNDHALATLDWAAARLALGEMEGVAAECRTILIRFESEGMMRNARLALAYVHEALARGQATPALLKHVRLYLELLPTRPDVAFTPLQ
ncbi:MAG TPA: hypothetical protein VEO54_03725 [Thermoanaerobaculia bacterium]|nr:hypothetical protein [Thermoanaerobaculia bacterium]